MRASVVTWFSIIALCLGGGHGNGGGGETNKQVKIAYLTKGVWKICLETDSGFVAPGKRPLDLRGFIHVSRIEVFAQYCDNFQLSEHVDDFLIVIPDRVGSKCFHFNDCYATIIVAANNIVVGNSKCYTLIQGHYSHDQGVQTINDFRITNMKTRGITCNPNDLDSLVRQKMLSSSHVVGDIWSPVEDIANGAVNQIKQIADQANTQIKNQLNVVQETFTTQFNKLSDTVQKQTIEVTRAVNESINTVQQKIEKLEDDVVKYVGIFERYFHLAMHILMFLGVCLVISWIYKLDRKATEVFHFLKWIWSKIHPDHSHQANNEKLSKK